VARRLRAPRHEARVVRESDRLRWPRIRPRSRCSDDHRCVNFLALIAKKFEISATFPSVTTRERLLVVTKDSRRRKDAETSQAL